MKFVYLIICILFFIASPVISQNEFEPGQLDYPDKFGEEIKSHFTYTEISEYTPDTSQTNTVILSNGFRKADIQNPDDWNAISADVIPEKVTLVFSKYPLRNGIYSEIYPLLCSRLKQLFLLDPLLNDAAEDWEIVLQTNCPDDESTAKLFHGVVIQYEPFEESVQTADSIAVDTISDEEIISYIEKQYKIPATLKDSVSKLTFKEKSKIYARFVLTQIAVDSVKKGDSLSVSKRIKTFISTFGNRDSTVFRIMDRNYKDLDSILVVADWTGSMYGYGAQILAWHVLHFQYSPIRYFVLFNDGDMIGYNGIGTTGGIYYADASDLEKVIDLYNLVMMKGSGGDSEENDLEATIKGSKNYPDHKDVILIADNSCIRDISLLPQITEPIHVLMCGYDAFGFVNQQYVDVARNTSGSIHTIEEDIDSLEFRKENKKGFLGDTKIKIVESYCDYISRKDYRTVPSITIKYSDIDSAKKDKFNKISLDLSGKNLSRIPVSIKKIDELNSLDLSENNIKKIPNFIKKQTSLQYLYLNKNQLKKIDVLKSLKNLVELDVSENLIKEFSSFLFELRKMETLNFSNNDIDSIPYKIVSSKIKRLNLEGNKLKQLPARTGNLRKLEELYVANNELTELPATLSRCKNLKILDLSNNNITELPAMLKRLKKLKVIIITGNPIDEENLEKITKIFPTVDIEY
ncbi:MAG: leucine-rich repeat domain-containing protein [Bacteroidota bacterium]